MILRRAAIALLPLLAPSSVGFSAGKPNGRRGHGRPNKGGPASAKARRKGHGKTSPRPKPLNTREKSFSQRDPIVSLNMNLDYLAKSGQRGAAARCEEMLLKIEHLHARGYYERAPDVVSYNSVVNAYARERAPRQRHARSNRSAHARRLLKRMEERGLAPNTVSYNSLLRCILKGRQAPLWIFPFCS